MKIVMNSDEIAAAVGRLTDQIAAHAKGEAIDLVGIRSRGDEVAERVFARLKEAGLPVRFGVLDISLYRDDYEHLSSNPTLQGSEIEFPVDGSRLVLVDDVIFTGRTIRAALDAIFDYGRPARIDLAVLIDRGHREIPIEPRFVGSFLETERLDRVEVNLLKTDGRDEVELVKKSS